MKQRVRIIPLADKGFVPISETNKVKYYITDETETKLLNNNPWSTYERAKKLAEAFGYEVME